MDALSGVTMIDHTVDLSTCEFIVHLNLNAKTDAERWSIVAIKGNDNRGLKVATASHLLLVGCRAVVKDGGRLRIASGKPREVCAWFIGKAGTLPEQISGDRRVTFRPHDASLRSFIIDQTGEPVWDANGIYFHSDGNAYIVA